MAAFERSNRELWHFITGKTLRRPPELIGKEISLNKDRLTAGLGFYKPLKKPIGDLVKKKYKLEGVQLEFVKKLATFMDLDEIQTYQLFCKYLVTDYRGSQKELITVFSSDRHSQALILKVNEFYRGERLHLLHVIQHILSHWQEDAHPYQAQYTEFLQEATGSCKFIEKIIAQYENICDAAAPVWEKHGNLMNERQAAAWMIQNLKEQCELLQILILFYKDFEHPADSLLKLATRFKKQGFGRRQINKHILDEAADPLIHKIGHLQVILLIEGFDLEYLYKHQEDKPCTHHIISSSKFKELDQLICSLGDCAHHGPLLLMWAAVHHLIETDSSDHAIKKLGHQAQQWKVFHYLHKLLETEPFDRKDSFISIVTYNVLYGLLYPILSIFHEETLGDTEMLYSMSAKLMSRGFIADDVWSKGEQEGLGMLLHSALNRFPLDFHPLMQLLTGLSEAGPQHARKVILVVQQLPLYTEYFINTKPSHLIGLDNGSQWQISEDKMPYGADCFIIPAGTTGVTGENKDIVQWQCPYNGWQLFWCELGMLLDQIAQGTGAVHADNLSRVEDVLKLLQVIMTSEPQLVQQFTEISDLVYMIVQRFCLVSPTPLDLLAVSLQVLTCVAKEDPLNVWHKLQQTGFLPFLTENFDDLTEYVSGAGLNSSSYGSVLAGTECMLGQYGVTCAVLELCTILVKPLHKANRSDELLAMLLFVSRETFPAFHKWRYMKLSMREQIGQKCLELYHAILNTTNDNSKPNTSVSLKELCVYSLMYSDSGRALLDIVSTGTDVIESVLAGNISDSVGLELIQLLRLALSVMNRLLIIRPVNASGQPSPVEQALSCQPVSNSTQHIVAIISHYIYHRHDTRLCVLATILLKRIAIVFPMSMLACLGPTSEAVREMFLCRLQANTEDPRLKVVILELMSSCVESQPGLIEMFLNLEPDVATDDKSSKTTFSSGSSCGLLDIVDSLLSSNVQSTHSSTVNLLCAALEFIHALWHSKSDTAMSVLRKRDSFWLSSCSSLMRDLRMPEPNEDGVVSLNETAVKTCAHIIHILALELYYTHRSTPDKKFIEVFSKVVNEGRLTFWSEYLCACLSHCVCNIGDDLGNDSIYECLLDLLRAWRALMVILTKVKIPEVNITDLMRENILKDILTGVRKQVEGQTTKAGLQFASICSALYFTMISAWKTTMEDFNITLPQLSNVLSQSTVCSQLLLPNIQIGIVSSIIVLLQHRRQTKLQKDFDVGTVQSTCDALCTVLQQSTYQLPLPQKTEKTNSGGLELKLKLQMMCIHLLDELIISSIPSDIWLDCISKHTILQILLPSLQQYIQAQQGIHYVHAAYNLMLRMAKTLPAAEALCLAGLTQNLCLPLTTLYSNTANHYLTTPKKSNKPISSAPLTWLCVYRLHISLCTIMLETLNYNFIDDAFNFLGVHQERVIQCIGTIHTQLQLSSLSEVEESCAFIRQLSYYKRQWRLHLTQVLGSIMFRIRHLTQVCAFLLIRPKFLQHIIDSQNGLVSSECVSLMTQHTLSTPLMRQLSSQSDDSDTPAKAVQLVQQKLLQILSHCLSTMSNFSPNLCEILLDQSLDTSEFEPLLDIAFGSPVMDQDSIPSFGTPLTCANLCLRLLNKMDNKGNSPGRHSGIDTCIEKSLVVYVLEMSLYLVMTQASRYLRDQSLNMREKQLLKRELNAELNSILMIMQRHLRKGGIPTSPSPGTQITVSPKSMARTTKTATRTVKTPVKTPSKNPFSGLADHGYYKLIDNFMKTVLR